MTSAAAAIDPVARRRPLRCSVRRMITPLRAMLGGVRINPCRDIRRHRTDRHSYGSAESGRTSWVPACEARSASYGRCWAATLGRRHIRARPAALESVPRHTPSFRGERTGGESPESKTTWMQEEAACLSRPARCRSDLDPGLAFGCPNPGKTASRQRAAPRGHRRRHTASRDKPALDQPLGGEPQSRNGIRSRPAPRRRAPAGWHCEAGNSRASHAAKRHCPSPFGAAPEQAPRQSDRVRARRVPMPSGQPAHAA